MAHPAYPVDPEVVQDLLATERFSTFLGSGPLRPEFWEVFALLKVRRPVVLEEIDRLTRLRAEGLPATINAELAEKLLDVRRELYGLASDLRPVLSKFPEMRDGMRLELALVFIMGAAGGRAAAAGWVADAARKAAEAAPRIKLMARMADAYCRALMEVRRTSTAPLPEAPSAPGPAPATPDEEDDIVLKPVDEPASPAANEPRP